MRLGRRAASVAAGVVLLLGGASAASAQQPLASTVAVAVGATAPTPNVPTAQTPTVATPTVATPIAALTSCSAQYLDGDFRLGPQTLPLFGDVGRQLFLWRRTGNLGPDQFLATYWDPGTGSWRYPPRDGFVIGSDGQPEKAPIVLPPGTRIDRYGSEYGGFLAPDDTPYAERSIPPSNLDGNPAAGCNYHEYRVQRGFTVYGGPIAPWFAQPGGGIQYQLDGALVPGAPAAVNVAWLADHGYLTRTR